MKTILSLLAIGQIGHSLITHSPQYDQCGTKTYYTLTQRCCNQQTVYDFKTEICCTNGVGAASIGCAPITVPLNGNPPFTVPAVPNNGAFPKLIIRAADAEISDTTDTEIEDGDNETDGGDDAGDDEGDDVTETDGDENDGDDGNDEGVEDTASTEADDIDEGNDDDIEDGDDNEDSNGAANDEDDDNVDGQTEDNDEETASLEAAGTLFDEKDGSKNGYNSDLPPNSSENMDTYTEIILANMWAILAFIVFMNITFYFCYCRRNRNKNYKKRVMSNTTFADHSAIGVSEDEDII